MQYLDLRKGDVVTGKTIESVKLEQPHVVITFTDGTQKTASSFSAVRGAYRPTSEGTR